MPDIHLDVPLRSLAMDVQRIGRLGTAADIRRRADARRTRRRATTAAFGVVLVGLLTAGYVVARPDSGRRPDLPPVAPVASRTTPPLPTPPPPPATLPSALPSALPSSDLSSDLSPAGLPPSALRATDPASSAPVVLTPPLARPERPAARTPVPSPASTPGAPVAPVDAPDTVPDNAGPTPSAGRETVIRPPTPSAPARNPTTDDVTPPPPVVGDSSPPPSPGRVTQLPIVTAPTSTPRTKG